MQIIRDQVKEDAHLYRDANAYKYSMLCESRDADIMCLINVEVDELIPDEDCNS